tara:strand:- start:109 stop:438 length:330 start_codon:yes stop_codon:yes gene_type:complete
MVDISEKELRDIIHKEEVKAIRNSIDKKELKRKVKEYKKYKEYTKKSYHPISFEIEKELRERDASGEYAGLTDADVREHFDWAIIISVGVMAFWYMIGALFFIGMLMSL